MGVWIREGPDIVLKLLFSNSLIVSFLTRSVNLCRCSYIHIHDTHPHLYVLICMYIKEHRKKRWFVKISVPIEL